MATPERRAYNKQRYRETRATRLAAVKAYKQAHPDKVRDSARKHYETNKERINAKRKAARESASKADPKGYWFKQTFKAARLRAKKHSLPYDQVVELQLPDVCPILGIRLDYTRKGKLSSRSPSIDRIKPEHGYVASNLRVISNRANVLKNNATLDEMRAVLSDLERAS